MSLKTKFKMNVFALLAVLTMLATNHMMVYASEENEPVGESQTATGSALMLMTTSDTDIASGTSYGMDWVIDAEGTLTITGVCDDSGSTKPTYGWQDYLADIKKVYLDATIGTTFYQAFKGATNLTVVEYGENFDPTGLFVYESTSMVDMFGNTGLETIDFSMWDFSKFEDLGNLFGSASYANTKNITFAGCDFSGATDMSSMFYEMDTLESVDIRGCTMGTVTTVQNMFSGCTSLREVRADGLVVSSVKKTIGMFRDCSSLESITMEGWDTSGVTDMDFMFHNCASLQTLDLSDWNTDSVTSMNLLFTGCSGLTDLNVTGWNMAGITQLGQNSGYASTTYGMFEGCSLLESLDLSGWDVSNVTTMYRMCADCASLKSINMSGWNTASLKNMYEAFDGCTALKEIDISGFDTSKVTTMRGLFSGCSSLTDVTVGNIDISSVTSLRYLFANCSSLETVDLSGLDTSNVEDMYGMFTGCTGLKYLDISNFDMENVAANDRTAMFYDCTALDVLLLPAGDSDYPAQKYSKFSFTNCYPNRIAMPALSKSQFHYGSDGSDARYALYEDDTMTICSDGYEEGLYSRVHRVYITGNYVDENGTVVHSIEPQTVFQQVLCTADSGYNRDIPISSIDLTEQDFDYENEEYKWTFTGELSVLPAGADYTTYNNEADSATENIHRVSDEYSYVYALKFARTSNEPEFTGIAKGECEGLEWWIDEAGVLHIIGTGSTDNDASYTTWGWYPYREQIVGVEADCIMPTDSEGFFYSLANAEYFNFGSNFSVAKTQSIYQMFKHCSAVTELDVSGWDTASMNTLAEAFAGCSSLESIIGIGDWDVSGVTTMAGMFQNSGVTALDLSGWTTTSINNISYMFSGSFLETLDVSGWDASKVTTMKSTFYDCTELVTITGLDSWDVSEVGSFNHTFYNCPVLTTVGDISGWNTGKATIMDNMFSGCEALVLPDLSVWDVSEVTSMRYMFEDCHKLTGFDMTDWNPAELKDSTGMFKGCTGLNEFTMAGVEFPALTTMFGMFEDCSSLTTINMAEMQIPEVTTMNSMFLDCENLQSINMIGVTTPKVVSTDSMFDGCKALSTVAVEDGTFGNVTDAEYMLRDCQNYTFAEAEQMDFSKVTDARNMFERCYKLTEEAIETLNFSSVTDAYYMFAECTGLNSTLTLALPSVVNAGYLFYGCENLDALDISSFETSVDLSQMLGGCNRLSRVCFSEEGTVHSGAWNMTDSDVYFAEYEDDAMEAISLNTDGMTLSGWYARLHEKYVFGNYCNVDGNVVYYVPSVTFYQQVLSKDSSLNREIPLTMELFGEEFAETDYSFTNEIYSWVFTGKVTLKPEGTDYETYDNSGDSVVTTIQRVAVDSTEGYLYAMKFDRTTLRITPGYVVILPATVELVIDEADNSRMVAEFAYRVNYQLEDGAAIIIRVPEFFAMTNEAGESLMVYSDKQSSEWTTATEGVVTETDGNYTGSDCIVFSAGTKAGEWTGNLTVEIEVVE